METKQLIPAVVKWIKDYADKANIEFVVVGVSGGIDSAVVCRLCELTGKKVIAVAMPLEYTRDSCPGSLQRAMELTDDRGVTIIVKPIRNILEAYLKEGCANAGEKAQLLQGNLRSRIRANILYDIAGAYGGIVVGTGNKDEDEIGYFTKGGDGLVDICPLSLVHKSQVREMAKELDVPQSIIDAVPSAGLWDGQTDEQELGMTYDEVEWALKALEEMKTTPGWPIESDRHMEVMSKVIYLQSKNKHKLRYPPVFDPDNPERCYDAQ